MAAPKRKSTSRAAPRPSRSTLSLSPTSSLSSLHLRPLVPSHNPRSRSKPRASTSTRHQDRDGDRDRDPDLEHSLRSSLPLHETRTERPRNQRGRSEPFLDRRPALATDDPSESDSLTISESASDVEAPLKDEHEDRYNKRARRQSDITTYRPSRRQHTPEFASVTPRYAVTERKPMRGRPSGNLHDLSKDELVRLLEMRSAPPKEKKMAPVLVQRTGKEESVQEEEELDMDAIFAESDDEEQQELRAKGDEIYEQLKNAYQRFSAESQQDISNSLGRIGEAIETTMAPFESDQILVQLELWLDAEGKAMDSLKDTVQKTNQALTASREKVVAALARIEHAEEAKKNIVEKGKKEFAEAETKHTAQLQRMMDEIQAVRKRHLNKYKKATDPERINKQINQLTRMVMKERGM